MCVGITVVSLAQREEHITSLHNPHQSHQPRTERRAEAPHGGDSRAAAPKAAAGPPAPPALKGPVGHHAVDHLCRGSGGGCCYRANIVCVQMRCQRTGGKEVGMLRQRLLLLAHHDAKAEAPGEVVERFSHHAHEVVPWGWGGGEHGDGDQNAE